MGVKRAAEVVARRGREKKVPSFRSLRSSRAAKSRAVTRDLRLTRPCPLGTNSCSVEEDDVVLLRIAELTGLKVIRYVHEVLFGLVELEELVQVQLHLRLTAALFNAM